MKDRTGRVGGRDRDTVYLYDVLTNVHLPVVHEFFLTLCQFA